MVAREDRPAFVSTCSHRREVFQRYSEALRPVRLRSNEVTLDDILAPGAACSTQKLASRRHAACEALRGACATRLCRVSFETYTSRATWWFAGALLRLRTAASPSEAPRTLLARHTAFRECTR